MADTTLKGIQLSRDIRRDIAKQLEKMFITIRPARIVITYDTHAIQAIIFPPSESSFIVPGGPHTLSIRDGVVEE